MVLGQGLNLCPNTPEMLLTHFAAAATPTVCVFVFFFFFFFSQPHLYHMEVPGLGVKSELELPADARATAMLDP